jgi:hypothetical protein
MGNACNSLSQHTHTYMYICAHKVQHLAYRWGRHADEQTGVYAAPRLSAAPSAGVIIVNIDFIDCDWSEILVRGDGSIYSWSSAKFVDRTAGRWA